MDTFNNESYFSEWFNKKVSNLGSFDTQLFQLYIVADGTNRETLEEAFPYHFQSPEQLEDLAQRKLEKLHP